MGIFSRIKNGISGKANSVLDKAIDPEKELEMAILELEAGRKKALQELVTYKATAKTLDNDIERRHRIANAERAAFDDARAQAAHAAHRVEAARSQRFFHA